MSAQIRDVLEASLSADGKLRNQAEKAIQQLKLEKGFIVALLDCLLEPSWSNNAKLSAVLILKNTLVDQWSKPFELEGSKARLHQRGGKVIHISESAKEGHKEWEVLAINENWIAGSGALPDSNIQIEKVRLNDGIICGEDRYNFRSKLFNVLMQVPPQIRAQLQLVFKYVIYEDFPQFYPSLIPTLKKHLEESTDALHCQNAAIAARVLLRRYQFSANLNNISPHFQNIFPGLLRILGAALQSEDPSSWFTIKTILRAYLCPNTLKVLPYFQQKQVQEKWMPAIRMVLEKVSKLTLQADSHRVPEASKCRKWALDIVFRMLTNYGRPNLVAESDLQGKQFAEFWGNNYKTGFLEAVFMILKKFQEGEYVYSKCLCKCYAYINLSVDDGKLFQLMRPHLNFILSESCLKSIVLSKEDLELWESDPAEFARAMSDTELKTPRRAALGCFFRLVQIRTSFVLKDVLEFMSSTIKRKDTHDQESILKKEAGMQVFVALKMIFLDVDDLRSAAKELLENHVVPDLLNPNPIIRAQAQHVVGSYPMFKFNKEKTQDILKVLIANMGDSNLVVQVEAATAVSELLLSNHWCDVAKLMIVEILEKFLSITDKLGSHHMLSITSSLIDSLGDELTPYAVQLLEKLLSVFMHLYQEAFQGTADVQNEDSFEAVVSCLGGLKILIMSCHESPESLQAMIPIIEPLITAVFSGKISDFHEDVYSILGSFFQFCSPPPEWCYQQYEKIINSFFEGKRNFLTESLDPLTQLIAKDPHAFVSYKDGLLVKNLTLMIENILVDESDKVATTATRILITCLLTNCEGAVDPIISDLMKYLDERTKQDMEELDHINLASSFAVICWYNPNLFAQCGGTRIFSIFGKVAQALEWFERRIIILALCRILSLPPDRSHDYYKHHMGDILNLTWELVLYSKEMELQAENNDDTEKLINSLNIESRNQNSALLDLAEGTDVDRAALVPDEDGFGDFLDYLKLIEEDDTDFPSPLDHENEVIAFWVAVQNIQLHFDNLYQRWMSNVPEHLQQKYQQYLKEAQEKESKI